MIKRVLAWVILSIIAITALMAIGIVGVVIFIFNINEASMVPPDTIVSLSNKVDIGILTAIVIAGVTVVFVGIMLAGQWAFNFIREEIETKKRQEIRQNAPPPIEYFMTKEDNEFFNDIYKSIGRRMMGWFSDTGDCKLRMSIEYDGAYFTIEHKEEEENEEL